MSAGAYAVYFPSDGELNISGGTVNGGITGVEIRAGALNMTGGVVKGNCNGAYDTVQVNENGNGTTTAGVDIAIAKHTTNHNLIVTIKGGNLEGTTSIYESKPQGDASGAGTVEVKIESGEFSGEIFSQNCTEFVSGGVFAKDPTDYVAPEASVVKDSTSYGVGADATTLVEAAEDGDTLTLIRYDAEITVPEGVTIENDTGSDVKVNGNTVATGEELKTTHELVKTEAKEATCTAGGNIAYWYCTICDKYFSDEACTAEITEAETKTAAKGHDAAKIEAKEATCTAGGNSAYWHCTICGKYFSDEACTQEITLEDTVFTAMGHGKTELKNAKEATCTAEGYTGDQVCKDCGAVVEAGKSIEKTAHTYKDGKCTVCGAEDPSYKPSTQPETGDNSNITLYLVMMLAAGVGLTGTVVYNKKRKATR